MPHLRGQLRGFWALWVGLCLCPPQALAQATRVVYGGDAHFPPYEFLDERGEPQGLNVDLMRAVAAARGWTVEFRLGPWSEVQPGLVRGELDVAAMYRSARRAQQVDFAIAHELVYHEVFVPAGAPTVTSLQDLSDKRVLVEVGTYSDDTLSDLGWGPRLVRVGSEPEALRALAAGRADAAVVSGAVGRPFKDRAGLTGVVPTGPPVLLTEYAFVVRKGRWPLVEALNEGVSRVKASGEFSRIYDRWIHPDASAQRVRSIAWALVATLGLVLLVVAWNRSLQRRVAVQTRALRREFEERERGRLKLEESERALRQAQKLEVIGRLTGGVAHDFNNILSVVLNYGFFLREELLAKGLPTSDVDEILAASERAARLTKQLLAFSRATPVQAVHLDLAALVQGTLAMVHRLVGAEVELESSAPDHPVVVEADPTQLEQILLNLAANARDAMPGHGRLEVTVGERTLPDRDPSGLPAGDYAVLRVRDTGCGMSPEVQARIFDPFFTTKEPGRGTGLGLATVFALVERLRGRIRVESAVDQGSTFEVLLPRSACPPTPVSKLPRQTIAPRGRGETVLLVEDDEALRRAARTALQQGGYSVLEAGDGEEARQLAEATPPRVVVTDVVLPRLSGPRLVADLRRRHGASLRVLFVSGYVSQSESLDLAVPGTRYLAKPYLAAALVEAVHALLAPVDAPAGPAAH